jgi:hypothetical protein
LWASAAWPQIDLGRLQPIHSIFYGYEIQMDSYTTNGFLAELVAMLAPATGSPTGAVGSAESPAFWLSWASISGMATH